MRLVFALLISTFLFSTTQAAPKAYFDQNLSGWSETYLNIDGQIFEPNPWKAGSYDIGGAFNDNPQAAGLVEEHQTHALRATIALWPSIAAIVIGAANSDTTGGDIAFWTGIVGVFYTGYESRLSRAYLFKAINVYNGVSYKSLGSKGRSSELELAGTPAGVTVGLRF